MADYYIQATRPDDGRDLVEEIFHLAEPGATRSLCGRVKVKRLRPAGDVVPKPDQVCKGCRFVAG